MDRFPASERHDSMRGWFSHALFEEMDKNPKIRLLLGDLGYAVFDKHREFFPKRVINVGAAEVSLINIGVGMAQEGLIPVVYSITPFLLWRPAEQIRLYVNKEKWPVKLVGSGRDADYHVDGFSHNASDAQQLLSVFPNIYQNWPRVKEDIPSAVEDMINRETPYFVSLTR